MSVSLKTYTHSRKLLTNFEGDQEHFSVLTKRITLCSNLHLTEVFYDLSTFDPEGEKNFVVWQTQSTSIREALANHIALVKLVLKEEPINWNQDLIDDHKPKQLLDSLKLPIPKFNKSFRSDYSKAALAICQMYPR